MIDKDALVFGAVYAENAENIRFFGNGLFDDSITIKGIDRYAQTDNENILSENCVLWCACD